MISLQGYLKTDQSEFIIDEDNKSKMNIREDGKMIAITTTDGEEIVFREVKNNIESQFISVDDIEAVIVTNDNNIVLYIDDDLDGYIYNIKKDELNSIDESLGDSDSFTDFWFELKYNF